MRFWKFFLGIIALLCLGGPASARRDAQPGNYIINQGTTIDDFEGNEVTTTWSQLGPGSHYPDSVHIKRGSQSIGVVSDPSSYVAVYRPITLDLSKAGTFSVWVYIDGPCTWNVTPTFALYFMNDWGNFFLAQDISMHPGWTQVTFSKADFVGTGNPSWQNVNGMILRLNNWGSGNVIHANFDDLDFGEVTRAKVIFSFDDIWDTTYNAAYPKLASDGLVGSIFAVSSFADKPNRCTTAQLTEMYNAGWDICNHTATHPDLTTLSVSDILNEYTTCDTWLQANGFVRGNCNRHLAYPFGRFNDNAIAAAQQVGFYTARATVQGRQANSLDSQYMLNCVTPDPATIHFAEAKAMVDKLIAGGGCLQFCFHRIVPDDQIQNANDWGVTDYGLLVDYVAQMQQSGALDVIRVSDWYSGITGSGQSQTVTPASYSLFRGVAVSGDVNSLAAADQSYLQLQPSITLNAAEAPVQVLINAVSPFSSVSKIKFDLVGHADTPGIGQKLELFDWGANAYVTVDSRSATTTDSTVEVSVSNPNRFIQPGTNALLARVSYRVVGPTTHSPFNVFIDQTVWSVTPQTF